MVKFLADENIPPVIIDFIRKRGFNIEDVYKIGKPGLSDEGIMEIARAEGRILITFDKHFADIINYPPYSHHGVIRIRIHPPLISSLIEAFERFLEKFDLSKFEGLWLFSNGMDSAFVGPRNCLWGMESFENG